MFNKLKQFKEMRSESKKMKAMLDEVVIVGSGASGKVLITMNGSHEVLGVSIEDGLEKARIEQGVKDAMADVNKKLQTELVKKMQASGGLGGLADMMKGMSG